MNILKDIKNIKNIFLFFIVLSFIYLQIGCRIANTVESATGADGGGGGSTPTISEQLKINASKSSINLTEGSNTILLVVSDKPAGKKVILNWEITGSGSGDFTSQSGSTFLLAGETSFSITINTVNDSVYEPTKSYNLTVWSDDKRVKNNLDIGITLSDDDPQYQLSFSSSAQTLTESSGSVNIPVSFSNAYGSDVTINYSVSGTATENSDFSITGSGSVVMTGGQTSVDIPLTITDDSLIEGDETIILTVTGTNNVDIEMGAITTHTITLNDNDIAVKPNAGYLIPNETLSLTVTGGDGSFTYAMVGSPASTINGSGVITAASSAETFTVRVTDGSGNTKDVNYEVIDPKSDSTLSVWVKASELSLSDGAAVASWPDLTSYGHNFSQGTSTYQPLFVANGLNSKPVVRFDGSNDLLESNYLPPIGASARSFTAVVSGLYRKGGSAVFSYGTNSYYGGEFGLTIFSPSVKSKHSGTFLIDTHDNTSWQSAPYVPDTTQAYVITVDYTGSAARYYINGQYFYGFGGALSTGSSIKLKLGKRHGTGPSGEFFKGDLAELLVHETTLTSDDRTKLHCYLARVYNIPLVQSTNCGVQTLKWKYRGSISLRASDTMTPEAFGGVPPYTYSVVSGTSTIDASTGLLTASGSEETVTIRVTDNVGQTADLDVDVVGIPVPLSWMNLAKGATGYTDGSKAYYIRDISGNENHYSNLYSSNSPVYRASSLNSQPVLEFTGSQFLSGAFIAPYGTSARSFAFVVNNTSSGAFISYGALNSCGNLFQIYASSSIKADRNCGTYTSTATVTTAAKLYVVVFTGSTMQIYENGVSVFSGAASFNTKSTIGLQIGSNYINTGTFLNGNIAEFMAFDTALSASDRSAVETYLMTKFGL